MKKTYFLFIGVLLMMFLSLNAQDYCLTAPIGYGAGTTGGGNAAPVIVSNYNDLKTQLTASGNKVIIVSGTITFPSNGRISVTSNKTLLGLPGAKLVSNDQTASGSGILRFCNGVSNVIIRNLIFEGPGAYDVDGNDLLTNYATRLWVDHCEFYDGVDGNFDNTNSADNITISWCKFGYKKPPKSGGSGGSNDHRFSNLVGGDANDAPSDGKYSITFAYCYWSDGCRERMPRARNAQLHILNCYYNTSVPGSLALGLEAGKNGTDCYAEASYFENIGTIYRKYPDNSAPNPNLTMVNCIRNADGTSVNTSAGTAVAKPSYSYIALPKENVKAAITNVSCGAGATLLVTETGVVSTPCSATIPTINLTSDTKTTAQILISGAAIQTVSYAYSGTATGFSVTYKEGNTSVSKPSWLSENRNGNTISFTGITPSVPATTVYSILVKSTDAAQSSIEMAATITINPTPSENAKKIAYVTIPNDPADAPVLNKLNNNLDFNVTIIDASNTGVNYSEYDLIVISATPNSGSAGLPALETVDKPRLLLKPFQLQASRWNWTSAGVNTPQTTMTIEDKIHAIFTNIPFTGTNNDELVLFSAVSTNAVTGVASWTGNPNVNLLAVAKGTNTQSLVEIPVGTNMNGTIVNSRFLMIGVSEYSTENLTPTATQLIENACYYLLGIDIPTKIFSKAVLAGCKIVQQSDILSVTSEHNIESIQIYAITGSLLFQSKGNNEIDIGMLPKGIYLVNVVDENGYTISRKFLKK